MEKTAWYEIIEGKEEMSHILRLLVEFDEKTGRYQKYPDPETHYMRKAIAVASESTVRYFFNDRGGFVYSVIAECVGKNGTVTSGWEHEDGIAKERIDSKTDESHPVHKIVCVTDLFKKAAPATNLSQNVKELMQEKRDAA